MHNKVRLDLIFYLYIYLFFVYNSKPVGVKLFRRGDSKLKMKTSDFFSSIKKLFFSLHMSFQVNLLPIKCEINNVFCNHLQRSSAFYT